MAFLIGASYCLLATLLRHMTYTQRELAVGKCAFGDQKNRKGKVGIQTWETRPKTKRVACSTKLSITC